MKTQAQKWELIYKEYQQGEKCLKREIDRLNKDKEEFRKKINGKIRELEGKDYKRAENRESNRLIIQALKWVLE